MRISSTAFIIGVSTLLFLHCMLLAWMGARKTPNIDEIGHLSAGLSHWELRDFTLYRVNPPLVRMAAAAPVVLSDAKRDWRHLFDKDWRGRREWVVGEDFIDVNGERSLELFAWARWTCLPFSVIGGLVCLRWAWLLHGTCAGCIALSLWCLSPTVLGHASLITPDIGAAALGALATLLFWQWLKRPRWRRALLVGAALGAAELSKTTLLVFYPLWFLMLLVFMSSRRECESRRGFQMSVQLLSIVLVSLVVLNAGYWFHRSGRRLGDYRFLSNTLGGVSEFGNGPNMDRNRFADTIFADLPVPLPADYLLGIDMQKLNFEQGMWSYLRGAWRLGGWWYYYLYALAVKVPVGTWCLMGLAVGATIVRPGCNAWLRDEMIALLPGLAILVFVSSQTGFSVHSRYVIPALPFFFVWISKVGRVFEMQPLAGGPRVVAVGGVVALTWSIGSSLWAYPHGLSYFNELAGGPRNGGEHLLDSNIDWGQDLLYLRDWLEEHPDVTLKGLAFSGSYPTTLAGVRQTSSSPYAPITGHFPGVANHATGHLGPRPGWYALSVNYLYGRNGQYRYFLDHFEPVAMAGYSIYIYHITSRDADRVRGELGLPELPVREVGNVSAGHNQSSVVGLGVKSSPAQNP